MEVDAPVWVLSSYQFDEDSDNSLWSPGSIVQRNGHVVTVKLRGGEMTTITLGSDSSSIGDVGNSFLKLRNGSNFDEVDDLCHLVMLNEPEVLRTLKCRFRQDKIYTYTGMEKRREIRRSR